MWPCTGAAAASIKRGRAGELAFDLADKYDRDAFRAVFVKAAAAGPLPWPDQAFQRMPLRRSPSPSPPSSPVDGVSPPASPVAAPSPSASPPRSPATPARRRADAQVAAVVAPKPPRGSPRRQRRLAEKMLHHHRRRKREFAVGQRVEANFEEKGNGSPASWTRPRTGATTSCATTATKISASSGARARRRAAPTMPRRRRRGTSRRSDRREGVEPRRPWPGHRGPGASAAAAAGPGCNAASSPASTRPTSVRRVQLRRGAASWSSVQSHRVPPADGPATTGRTRPRPPPGRRLARERFQILGLLLFRTGVVVGEVPTGKPNDRATTVVWAALLSAPSRRGRWTGPAHEGAIQRLRRRSEEAPVGRFVASQARVVAVLRINCGGSPSQMALTAQ